MDLLSFVLIVPAAEDKDVVNRKLTVTLPDGSVQTADVPGSEVAESAEFEVPQDATVNAVCVNVDDAGNESEPRVQDLVIRDTFAPKAPGEIGVRVVSERTVEDTPPSE